MFLKKKSVLFFIWLKLSYVVFMVRNIRWHGGAIFTTYFILREQLNKLRPQDIIQWPQYNILCPQPIIANENSRFIFVYIKSLYISAIYFAFLNRRFSTGHLELQLFLNVFILTFVDVCKYSYSFHWIYWIYLQITSRDYWNHISPWVTELYYYILNKNLLILRKVNTVR